MHILTLDFETYWTKPAEGYTLSKMPASLYVMDPRFKAHGVAVKLDAGPSKWVTHDDIPAFFDAVPWKKVFVLGQNNAGFDNLILEWIYGRRALGYIDTMSMARAVLGVKAPGFSLDKLGAHLGLGGKQFYDALTNTQGIRDLPPHIEKALVPYALRDNDLCYAIFKKLQPSIPAQEWATIDWCAKCAVRPTLALDSALLWEAHHEEVERKKQVVASVGIGDYERGKSVFNSNDKFAALLKPLLDAYGDDLPMKASKGKNTAGKLTYAFSASDEEFVSLQEHQDERVAELVEARLAVKGSIVETRTKRMAEVADAMPGGLWPVGLSYSGAMATHRYSGSAVGGGNCLSGNSVLWVFDEFEGMHRVALRDLKDYQLVWDGESFVQHDGLVEQGTREVICYGGVVGTPDHGVYTDPDGEPVELSAVAADGGRITVVDPPTALDALAADRLLASLYPNEDEAGL
jgi:hypothetical protein